MKPQTHQPCANRAPSMGTRASVPLSGTITDPTALVTGLIFDQHTTLLAARDITGISPLLTYVVLQLVTGRRVFGQDGHVQSVLVVGVEEMLDHVKLRAKAANLPAQWPLHFVRNLLHPAKTPLQLLDESIVATGATAVIIDTLSARAVAQAGGGCDLLALSECLPPLNALRAEHGCSLLVVHDTITKRDDLRGAAAIGAEVDVIASVSKRGDASEQVHVVRFTGRLGAGELTVARRPETGDFDLVDLHTAPRSSRQRT